MAILARGAIIATTTIFHWTSLVNNDAATTHLCVVEHSDGFVSSGVINHLDEGESAWTAGFTIERDVDGEHLTGLGEVSSELFFTRAVWDASDEQFDWHGSVV
jgi:hypothetical protein